MKTTGPCRDSVPVWMGVDSPLGRLALRAEGGCLTGLYLPGQRHAPAIPPALRDKYHPQDVGPDFHGRNRDCHTAYYGEIVSAYILE